LATAIGLYVCGISEIVLSGEPVGQGQGPDTDARRSSRHQIDLKTAANRT
jgi:hypothetical protein